MAFFNLRLNRRGPLANEPGPSPWFLPPLNGLRGTRGKLTWRSAGDKTPAGGKSILVDHAGAFLMMDFYCWARRLGPSKLLVWHQTKRSAVERGDASAVHVHVFDLAELGPSIDARSASLELDASSESVLWANGHLACYQAIASQPPGVHRVEVPEALREPLEIFLLVSSASRSRTPGIHLWILRPGAGTLEVLPQNWFNEGTFDFGYQWITRVAREPQTGRLVGEGIRLRPFALDGSGTQVEEWLEVNPFGGKR